MNIPSSCCVQGIFLVLRTVSCDYWNPSDVNFMTEHFCSVILLSWILNLVAFAFTECQNMSPPLTALKFVVCTWRSYLKWKTSRMLLWLKVWNRYEGWLKDIRNMRWETENWLMHEDSECCTVKIWEIARGEYGLRVRETWFLKHGN